MPAKPNPFSGKLQETHENLSLDGKNMQKPSKTIVFCQTQAVNQNKIGQLWTKDRMTVTLSSDPQPANFAILHLPSLSSGSGRCLWSDPCSAGVAAESAELKKMHVAAFVFLRARGGLSMLPRVWIVWSIVIYCLYFPPLGHFFWPMLSCEELQPKFYLISTFGENASRAGPGSLGFQVANLGDSHRHSCAETRVPP